MSQMTPFLGAVGATSQVQQQQIAETSRHLRRAKQVGKNAASTTDDETDAVENPDAIVTIHEQPSQSQERKQSKHQQHPEEPESSASPEHIDLTA